MWTVDHEADVASDLSAFHRIDDPMLIEAARYFSLALRLAAYPGVLAAIAAEEERRRNGDGKSARGSGGAPTRVSEAVAIADAGDWVETRKSGART